MNYRYEISPGEMRTEITLQEPTLTRDAGAAQKPVWSDAAVNPVVWSRWINAHGTEAVQNEALKSMQRATVTIRHRDDVRTTWRVLKDGEAWQVLSVDAIRGQMRWMELVVEKVTGTV